MNFALAGAREGFGPFLGGYLQAVGFDPASTVVTMASGWLWAAWSAHAFWAMSGLCLVAVPLAVTLRLGRASQTAPLPNGPDLP